MTRQRALIVYVLVPVALGTLLLGLYFSRVPALQRLVSPKLPPLAENTWREYGVLENLQNALLLVMVVLAVRGAARAGPGRRRRLLAATAVLAALVFLEETDYGAHALRWVNAGDLQTLAPESAWSEADRKASRAQVWFNLHTGGERFKPVKRLVNGGVIVFFVLVPLVAARLRPGRSARWVPSLWLAAATVVGGLVRISAHALARWERASLARTVEAGGTPWETGSLGSNLSEFGELFLYYGALLYLVEQLSRPRDDQSAAPVAAGRR